MLELVALILAGMHFGAPSAYYLLLYEKQDRQKPGT
jgi:hypothetical protein